jgi:plastocyanin
MQKYGGIGLLAIVCALAACGGRSSISPANAGLTPSVANGMAIAFTLPKNTIGEELPGEGVGTKVDPKWGKVGGFTQSTTAQVLAFPPGTKVTITNLSHSLPHTLDAFKKIVKAPAHFPPSPKLSIPAQGNGILAVGYASGSIAPGKSVTVTLSNTGIYLIGCAFHYSEGMQDVIEVKAHATPGPTFAL